jgi:hypothetical protein
MLADPAANGYSFNGFRLMWAREVCDGVQASTYRIGAKPDAASSDEVSSAIGAARSWGCRVCVGGVELVNRKESARRGESGRRR